MTGFRYIAKEKSKRIPRTSGVYALNSSKEILYIGKAANLRERIKNHFDQTSYRDNFFIGKVNRVGYITTPSDIDALLLESQLIKKHQPKYNVMWKDDKKYFYVGITKEALPRVLLTHQPHFETQNVKRETDKNVSSFKLQVSRYIGPFVEGTAIKRVLKLLRKVFPYYTTKKHPSLACPYCHIGLCPGSPPRPKGAGEARSQSERQSFEKNYRKNIRNLAALLRGRRISVLKNLKTSMERASKEQDFEKAARLRDQVFSLENVASHAMRWQPSHDIVLPKPWSGYTRIEAYDISNIQGKQSTGSMVTFLHGKPAKEWYRKFRIRYPVRSSTPRHGGLGARARQKQAVVSGPNDYAMMEELISRRLKHPEWPYPDLMLIDGGKGQLSAALAALRKSEIRSPAPERSSVLDQSRTETKFLVRGTKSEILLAALAKKHNELFLLGRKNSVLLKNLPQEVSNLLLHVRDEAHRFAISYHRKLRKKSALE